MLDFITEILCVFQLLFSSRHLILSRHLSTGRNVRWVDRNWVWLSSLVFHPRAEADNSFFFMAETDSADEVLGRQREVISSEKTTDNLRLSRVSFCAPRLLFVLITVRTFSILSDNWNIFHHHKHTLCLPQPHRTLFIKALCFFPHLDNSALTRFFIIIFPLSFFPSRRHTIFRMSQAGIMLCRQVRAAALHFFVTFQRWRHDDTRVGWENRD